MSELSAFDPRVPRAVMDYPVDLPLPRFMTGGSTPARSVCA